MNIIEINKGEKIPFTFNENTINFDNKYLVNCQEKQRDIEKKINLFLDNENISEKPKGQYIANIIIPPKRSFYNENFELIEEDFNINQITLQLWAI